MTTTQIALDKKAHPLMMHLSISPKYGISEEQSTYDPNTQTSNIPSMSKSTCARTASTSKAWPYKPDDDRKEDD
jgi:hypothetical protein